METFFAENDYREYLYLMAEWCNRCKVSIWSYCLMPNHVHLIAAPETGEGLCRAIGEAHRRYTRYVNFQKGWKGHLWQGRFASFPMDEQHLLAAARYIELNPVKAGLVKRAAEYRWSSAKAHLKGEDDILVKVGPLLAIAGDWQGLLASKLPAGEDETFRRHERTGRPLGDEHFLSRLETMTARLLRKQKPGPKNGSSRMVVKYGVPVIAP